VLEGVVKTWLLPTMFFKSEISCELPLVLSGGDAEPLGANVVISKLLKIYSSPERWRSSWVD